MVLQGALGDLGDISPSGMDIERGICLFIIFEYGGNHRLRVKWLDGGENGGDGWLVIIGVA